MVVVLFNPATCKLFFLLTVSSKISDGQNTIKKVIKGTNERLTASKARFLLNFLDGIGINWISNHGFTSARPNHDCALPVMTRQNITMELIERFYAGGWPIFHFLLQFSKSKMSSLETTLAKIMKR